jgi:hypothetical protein
MDQSATSSDDPEEEEELATIEYGMLSVLDIQEPKTYRQARESPHWPDWKKAMDDEINSLNENNVWEVVPRPQGRRIVDGKWVFKAKGNALGELERFKARYVAKGYLQTKGIDYDEIFAAVARFDSLRLLLAITVCRNWRPR